MSTLGKVMDLPILYFDELTCIQSTRNPCGMSPVLSHSNNEVLEAICPMQKVGLDQDG